MGQAADADQVDARFRHGAHRGQGDSARRFHGRAPGDDVHRLPHQFRRHIVQHNDVRAGVNGLRRLGQ